MPGLPVRVLPMDHPGPHLLPREQEQQPADQLCRPTRQHSIPAATMRPLPQAAAAAVAGVVAAVAVPLVPVAHLADRAGPLPVDPAPAEVTPAQEYHQVTPAIHRRVRTLRVRKRKRRRKRRRGMRNPRLNHRPKNGE